MAIEIVVPRLGWSMDEGTLAEWLKKEGDFVSAGDMLFVLEGEKASQEIESFDAGILFIPPDAPQPGDTVVVGQRLGFLLAEGEAPPKTAKSDTPRPRQRAPSAQCTEAITPVALQSKDEPHPSRGARTVASPRARRKARELGIDWSTLPGSGRNGRVRERDVVAHAQSRAAPLASSAQPARASAAGSLRPLSLIRRTIAQRMIAAVQQTAPVTLTTKVDASSLMAIRDEAKVRGAKTIPGYSDMIVKLVASSLREYPELNACWQEGAVYIYDEVNIALAVDTDRGLVAPVLRNVDRLSLDEIAVGSRRLIEQARAGRLSESDYQGGTFTVTNLGMFDIEFFTPIINLPQSAILGVGRIADEPVIAGGQVVPGKVISLSLTFDHRVIDGAPAARWLQRLAQGIRHQPE
jgi:pyruvate dehydrogenase E2 component (dihydrolipoamide acetyltransferase)